METKKRKYNEIGKPELNICIPSFLKCMICGKHVYNYRWCASPYIYCSYDCLGLLILSHKNGYLDTKDDIMMFDDEQDKIFCSICSTIHSEKDRKWCQIAEEYERQMSWDSV